MPNKIKIINILPIGRSSSIFLHGLMEGHEEIITIIGNYYPEENDFIGLDIKEVVKRIYNKLRHMERDYYSESRLENIFPINKLELYLKEYLSFFGINKKTILIGIHYALAKSCKKDLSKVKYILMQSHNTPHFLRSIEDFPKQKMIFTVRDPRASFFSYKNKLNYITGIIGLLENYALFKRLSKDKYDLITIKHEDLNMDYKKIKKELIKFLDIKDSKSLNECTLFNIPWDYSQGKNNSITKNYLTKPNKIFVSDTWKNEMSTPEIKFIQFIFSDFMKIFNYKKIDLFDNFNMIIFNTKVHFLANNEKYSKKLSKGLKGFSKIPIGGYLILKGILLLYVITLFLATFIRIIFLNFKRFDSNL